MNNSITKRDYQTINYVLASGGISATEDLTAILEDHLIASGHLVVEHGQVYATAKGCRAVHDFHECEWEEVSRESVFDSKGRYRGEIVQQECWCGETRQRDEIFPDYRQRNPRAVL